MTCHQQGIDKVYWGESHRAAIDRAQDHWTALETSNTSYAVVKHQMNDHSNSPNHNFQFKVHESYQNSLERQIKEAILIDREDPAVKLNSKAEWGLNSIPRVTIVQDMPEAKTPGFDHNGQHNSDDHQAAPLDHNGQNTQSSSKALQRPTGNKNDIQNDPKTTTKCPDTTKKRKHSMIDHFGVSNLGSETTSQTTSDPPRLVERNRIFEVGIQPGPSRRRVSNQAIRSSKDTKESDNTGVQALGLRFNNNAESTRPPPGVVQKKDNPKCRLKTP